MAPGTSTQPPTMEELTAQLSAMKITVDKLEKKNTDLETQIAAQPAVSGFPMKGYGCA